MSRDNEGHGIATDDEGQEQPADKRQAPEPAHSPKQPKDDDMQPTREKSGF